MQLRYQDSGQNFILFLNKISFKLTFSILWHNTLFSDAGTFWNKYFKNVLTIYFLFLCFISCFCPCQAAFECMYTLLDSCLDRLDIFEFLNHVEDGLKDHYDIKMLTYLMLVRLAHLCPSAVLQSKSLFCLITNC